MDTDHPDEKSIITYVSSLYNGLPNLEDVLKVVKVECGFRCFRFMKELEKSAFLGVFWDIKKSIVHSI